jgi:hypothetical protein
MILNLIFIKSMDEDFINNITEPCILPNVITGGVNRNFCSSFLFLFPALYGYYVSYISIIIGSLICLLTSTAHHYYQARHKIIQMIDRICVNSIALFFIFHCIATIGCVFYANLMYLSATVALFIFVYIFYSHDTVIYEKYYCWVHIFAVSGIMFYIKAYHLHLTNCTGD